MQEESREARARLERHPRAARVAQLGRAVLDEQSAEQVGLAASGAAFWLVWYPGRPAAEQCEGCAWVTTQVAELSHLHSRDITYAVFCQGPYDESNRYRDFMGWNCPRIQHKPPSTRSSLGAKSA